MRTVEVTVTFVLKIEDPLLPVSDQLANLDYAIERLDHYWFLNRVTQKDGRKLVTRMDFKRPPDIAARMA
jgi:hypothetical protein